MENRYLYKAKTTHKEGKEFDNVWVKGSLIIARNKYYIHPVGNAVNVEKELGKLVIMHEVDPSTICQCTGMKDKNGKLIWENDIVNCITTDCEEYARQIVYDKEELDFKATNGKEDYGSEFEYLSCLVEIEVTGNVFDNPELLDGKVNDD